MSQTQVISVPITPSQMPGAIVVNIFALASTIALASAIGRITWLALRRYLKKGDASEGRECVFFHTQLGNYAACLIIGQLFNALAGAVGMQWLYHRSISEGFSCQFQAFTMQIGNASEGYFTTAIAVHTFNSLALKMRQSAIICRTTIIIGWSFTAVMGFVPLLMRPSLGPVYGPDGLGCGIRAVYPRMQFSFHVLPILLTSVFGAILYSLIFLVLRGTLKLRSGFKLTLNPSLRWNDADGPGENYQRFIARVAQSMLWYPVAYIALLLPYAITRMFLISGFPVSFGANAFASACWYSLCVVDVLLLYNTFRVLGPAFDARTSVATRKLASFGAESNLEKFGPMGLRGQQPDIERKILEYRSPSSLESLQMSSERSTMGHSAASSQSGIPIKMPEKAEFGNRDSEYSNGSLIGKPITYVAPKADYTWNNVPPARTPSPVFLKDGPAAHSRDSSTTSFRGLPPPPRQTRSPVLRKAVPGIVEPSTFVQSSSFTNYAPVPDQRLLNQPSLQAFGRRNDSSPLLRSQLPEVPKSPSPSVFSDDGEAQEPSEWSSRNLSYATRRHPSTGQPMLTAFNVPISVGNEENYISPATATINRSSSFTPAHRPSLSSSPRRTHRPLPSIAIRNNSVQGISGNDSQRLYF